MTDAPEPATTGCPECGSTSIQIYYGGERRCGACGWEGYKEDLEPLFAADQFRDLLDKFDIARWLHRNYEEIAADVGWETQDGTTVPFEDLPDDNKEVMNRLAERLQEELRERLDAEDDC